MMKIAGPRHVQRVVRSSRVSIADCYRWCQSPRPRDRATGRAVCVRPACRRSRGDPAYRCRRRVSEKRRCSTSESQSETAIGRADPSSWSTLPIVHEWSPAKIAGAGVDPDRQHGRHHSRAIAGSTTVKAAGCRPLRRDLPRFKRGRATSANMLSRSPLRGIACG